MTVGRIRSLHRYPVKSMAGEDLEAALLVQRGLAGDRAYALIDRETGRVVSAKRPRLWPGILGYQARLIDASVAGDAPVVAITLPDGRTAASTDRPALDALLSRTLGRPVALSTPPPSGATFEYHWPDQPGLRYQGRLYRDEITAHEMPPGTFFDSGTIHLLTTASLAELRARAPGSRFEPTRFRANLVIETNEAAGFVENDWVGRTIRIGATVLIRVTKPCIRCVMVNLDHRGAPADAAVLAAAFGHNGGNVGVKGEPLSVGPVRVGDPVVVE
jgi:MOSC domain-containing protein